MKVYDAQSLRNVALVGHSGAGKTQLLSALLFDAGAVNRLGRVDDGTTVTDYDEEEIARKHTLSASLAYVEWNRTKINFIDTPGHGQFPQRRAGGAARRLTPRSSSSMRSRACRCRPRKCGAWPPKWRRRGSSCSTASIASAPASSRALDSLRGVFGRTVIPIQIPIGEEKDFRGVVDLVAMKSWTFATDGSGKPSEGAIPGDLESAAQTARDALIEMVAEADDALMEKFFESGTLTQDELVEGLKRGVGAGRIFPLVCASAAANIGDAAAPRRDHQLRAVAGRSAVHGNGQGVGRGRHGQGL